jgi:uncharacterized protein YndB with AHSA1/START domain
MSRPADTNAITREIRIAASPSVVFPYFTDPEKLLIWKAVHAEANGTRGGSFRLDVTGRGDFAYGTYLEIDPPRRVVFSWRWANAEADEDQTSSVVEVPLTADGEGTLLHLVHRGVTPWRRSASGDGWTHYLARLAIAATGGDPGPDPWASAPTIGFNN